MTDSHMLVLGIDPGIAITGYGLVCTDGQNEMACVGYGTITTSSTLADAYRLKHLFSELSDLIKSHKPDSCAIEKLFFQRNVKTAISVGQARGVAMLTLAQSDLEIFEYTPNEVKQSVCGYGNATKLQVQRMVQTLLQLKNLPKPDDAADALAVAICHINHRTFDHVVRNSQHPA